MARYIDAERFKLWLQENYVLYDGDRYFNDIDAQPTADVVGKKDLDTITEAHEKIGYEKGYRDGYAQANSVEVVLCKDCKHWDTDWETHRGWRYCPMIDGLTDVDFFCADGERGGE